jgi:phenylalanyl-tRNA synthetase beta chain
MRVSLRWLGDYLELPTDDPEEVAAALGRLGHEVEGVERLEAPFAGVVVGRVAGRRPHPRADRLQLVMVEAGAQTAEVVCGAWNFEVGALVPLAQPGARLQGGLEVGEREIRGVRSAGMICSAAELGLGEDAAGILVLPPDLHPGADLATALPFPDSVLDVSITANRPDCMSMVGIARELSAYYQVPIRFPAPKVKERAPHVEVEIRIEDPVGCPRYVARPIRGLRVGDSPTWLQLRLRAAGIRPINNVVDATNYVLVELGQPIHAFDLDRLSRHTIVVRRAAGQETLRTLDGVDRTLHPEDLVIADAEHAVAIAGVMGGEATEVGPETSQVLIESAYFDPPTVLLTAKRHGLRTEASARFERGVDPNLAGLAADRVAELLTEVAGGQAAAGGGDEYPQPVSPWQVSLALSEVKRLLGVDISRKEAAGLLERLGFEMRGKDPITVTVPTFRPDVTGPADLVEEVARLYGYARIPETLPVGKGGGLPSGQRRLRDLRQVLVGASYFEAQTLSFIGPLDLERLRLPPGDPRLEAIRVANPLREQEGSLRTTLLPGLLQAVAYNRARRVGEVALFEIGKVFLRGGGELPDQPEMLAFVSNRPMSDFQDAAGLWEVIVRAMHLPEAQLRAGAPPPFHPGRSAQVVLGGEAIGALGELHPSVVGAFELAGSLAAGEISVERIIEEPGWWQLREPSPFPPVVFDLAFDLDEETPAGDLLGEVRATGGELLESVEVFDVFTGGPLPPGRKSVAIRLTMRAPDHTLSDEELAPLRKDIAEAVAERFSGRLRGA